MAGPGLAGAPPPREDWARAALASLADGGLGGVVAVGARAPMEVIDLLREIPEPADRLRRLFELAFPSATARHRALAADTAYVGHFQLQRAAPTVSPTGPDERRYLRHLFALLGTPTPAKAGPRAEGRDPQAHHGGGHATAPVIVLSAAGTRGSAPDLAG